MEGGILNPGTIITRLLTGYFRVIRLLTGYYHVIRGLKMRYLVITGCCFDMDDLSSWGTFSLCIGSPRTSFPACHTSLSMIDITNYIPCCLASRKQQSIGHLINC